MRKIEFRNKNEGTSVPVEVRQNQTFGGFVLNTGYKSVVGMTYLITANLDGEGSSMVAVNPSEMIPEKVTVVEVESCPKC